MNNQISTIVKQSGLQESKAETLMKSFTGYFGEAKTIVDQCKEIIVTSEDQVDLMQQAREARLKLKNIRNDCEKTRKELKEQSLREGRAIDGIANVIKALIVPVEEHLEKQEKYAEVQEELRVEKRLADRTEKLSKYVPDVTLYAIKDMDDEVFNNLLSGCKLSWEKAKKEEQDAEDKRIADEKDEADRQEKIRLENIELKKEADKKEKALEVERQKQADILRKANEEKEKVEAKLRAEKEDQLKKERDEKSIADAKLKADEEAKVKALLAPDKEKLLRFASELALIKAPSVQNKESDLILDGAMAHLNNAIIELQNGAKKL